MNPPLKQPLKQPPLILKEFLAFLREYNVIALALAFVMGAASNQLVKSLVDNVMMPFVTPLIPADRWQDAALHLGPVVLKWGAFLADFLHFAILALVVFIIAKKIFRLEKVGK